MILKKVFCQTTQKFSAGRPLPPAYNFRPQWPLLLALIVWGLWSPCNFRRLVNPNEAANYRCGRLESAIFGRPFVKRFAPLLSDRCLSVLSCPVCLSVCNVGVLWPNGWTHQDEIWHTGRPRPWPHCIR